MTPVRIVMAFVIRATSTAAARRRFESAQDRADRRARSDLGLDPDSLRRLGTAFTAQSIAPPRSSNRSAFAAAVFYLLTGNPLTLAAVGVPDLHDGLLPFPGPVRGVRPRHHGPATRPADRFDWG